MKIKLAFYLFVVLLLNTSCKKENTSKRITIATASNMQFVIKKIIKVFEQQRNIKCDIVIGSSGQLTSKIKAGAPYHVFVSANMKYPEEIYKSGFSNSTPKVYAYGNLVLWGTNQTKPLNIDILDKDDINHIAVANPKNAPYGIAAIQVLQQLNLHQKLKNKLVFGESISQTNQFISLKSAEIGFTSLSTVLSSELIKKNDWCIINKKYFSPIEQGVVIIKQEDESNLLALEFYHFLFSSEAHKILKENGYDIIDVITS